MSLPIDDGQDDLNVGGSNMDILREIDKFLEGYSSDGEELPLEDKNNELDKCEPPVDHKKNELGVGKTLMGINKSDLVNEISTKSNDIEYIGKNPAIFELLEDDEHYAVYDHNPNEANWNVFYKTLPPGEQQLSIKQEPGTDDVNGSFNTSDLISESNTQNELETFSFCSENLWNRKNQPFNIKGEPFDNEANITNKSNSPLHFCEVLNSEEDTLSKEESRKNVSNGSLPSSDTCTNNILDNFSFLSNFENEESNDFELNNPHLPMEIGIQDQDTVILEENSSKNISTSESFAAQEDILKSKIEMENFSFSLDNINKSQSSAATKPFIKNSTHELFAFNQPFNQIYNNISSTSSDQSNTEFTNTCKISKKMFNNGKFIENKEKVLQTNKVLFSPENHNNTNPFNFDKTQQIFSDNTMKNKNHKTWAPFKRNNYSDSRDQHQKLSFNFQDNRKNKKNWFVEPPQFKKHFNKPQSDKSRWYKQSHNEDFNKDFRQPVNAVWRGKNYFPQSYYKQIKPYWKKSRNREPKSPEIKSPQPIINFQLPFVPINKTCKSNCSWNLPVLSTRHNSDEITTQSVDEKNLKNLHNVSLNIPNGYHTYKHNSAAVKPIVENGIPKLFTSSQPSFDQIYNSTSLNCSNQSNIEFTNTCINSNNNFDSGKIIENKEKVLQANKVLVSPENYDNTESFDFYETQHIISDYLSPESLVGCTVKFTSRKLANTITRDQLIEALALYGEIENSWWTPDDFFFATYTSRKIAKHVYGLYPKNYSCSY
ncbi:putative uncharacterized protein DDB_G0282133 isoform X2 [Sipha flava]|uniref:Uncharacterized protein n=1 Tax=Sipha flava TaxID=143950 RepID=A0A8B8F353_9HEMI|nr:putative uncharacterized protein DDB_G0282133 isoform X2 [Sipha flava]